MEQAKSRVKEAQSRAKITRSRGAIIGKFTLLIPLQFIDLQFIIGAMHRVALL
jgi:hypothetical protein